MQGLRLLVDERLHAMRERVFNASRDLDVKDGDLVAGQLEREVDQTLDVVRQYREAVAALRDAERRSRRPDAAPLRGKENPR